MDQFQQAQPSKNYYKKLYCSTHSNKLMYKCQFQNCTNPLICSNPTCLEDHFHIQNDGRLVIVKINSSQSFKKFGQIERIFTKEDFASQAKQLKSFIDQLKLSMVSIYKDYKQLHIKKEFFLSQSNKPFQNGFQEKLDETIALGNNLRKNIDSLKNKVNLSNLSVQNHSEQNNYKNYGQSPKYSQISNNSYIQSQKNKNKGIYNKQEGQMGFQSSPRNNLTNNQVPIDLQISTQSVVNNFSFMQKPIISQNNILLSHNNSKSPLRTTQKDKFDDLFKTNTSTPIKSDNQQKNILETQSNPSNSNKLLNGKIIPSLNHNMLNGNSEKQKKINNSYNQIVIDNDQNIDIPNNLKSSGSQSLKIYQRKFFMKQQLTLFLEKTIKNFSWGLFEQIYSTYMPLKPIDKFHQMLEGKRNLLFLYIGENKLLGSYYPSRYPRLTQKLRTDPNSFLFISNNQGKKIIQYKAVPSQFHLSVSDKLYICQGNTPSYADGIRTFQKNFQAVNYCLPSFSYKYQPNEDQEGKSEEINSTFNGILSVKEFFVLQFAEHSN